MADHGMMADDSANEKYADDIEQYVAGKDDIVDVGADDEFNVKNQTYGQGSWFEAGYHVATTIGTPAAFAPLAFAFALLGWGAGVTSLIAAWAVAYYNSILLASLHQYGGHRHVRFGTVGRAIYGAGGEWTVIAFQQIASLGNNLGVQIAAALAMKSIYKSYNEDSTMKLWHFILLFGVFEWALSQLPDIHSLRHINSVCTVSTLCFGVAAVAGSVYNGNKIDATPDYAVLGNNEDITWSVLTGLGIVAFAFGDTILPEVQATLKDPPERNMYKGLTFAFTVLITSYVPVAVAGYWAFGNSVTPWLINSFLYGPKWLRVLANLAAVIQIVGCYQIYCRPTYEWIDVRIQNPKEGPFSRHNVICRLVVTTIYIAIMTTVAAMLPFFADFLALVGAIGFTPLDFVLPIVFYTKAKKTGPLLTTFNYTLAGIYSLIGVGAAIAAIKTIIDHVQMYSLFADLDG